MYSTMKSKSLSTALPVLLSLSTLATPGSAEELGSGISLAVQYKQLEMEQKFSGLSILPNSASGDLKATLPVLNLQGILFYENLYTVLKIEQTLADSNVDSSIPFTTEGTSLSTDVSRDDISLVLGYNLNINYSIFMGYTQGKTELTPEACADITCTNAASVMLQDGYSGYKQEYEESGFFVGVSLGSPVASGKLSGSLAYAFMDGEYSDNYRDQFGPSEFDYEGRSKGVSASVNWTAPLTDNLFYFVDGRAQRYSMDADDVTGLPSFAGSKVSTDESILGLSAGLQLFF